MKLSDFLLDKNTGVYILSNNNYIFYSEGSEDKILNIIKRVSDKSFNSQELESYIDDYYTRYHFSNLRANILRAIELNKDSNVLEIGSGCGAITRFLGENFKSVDSIEGNFKRACIAKERCKDLDNVRIYASSLQDISFDKKYDVVVLIGALEYAPIFYSKIKNKEDACGEMLKQVVNALKENGILILAIENKFGLKYWSGCSEDHIGKLFASIHGYFLENTPITFSRYELKKMLEKINLKYYKFYYPFPDYKFATTILQEIEEPYSYYLHNWLIMPPFEDYLQSRIYSFNETLAIKSLVKSGLIYDFSNSFLILASRIPFSFPENWIVKRFSTNRITPYRIVTFLQKEDNSSSLIVRKQKLFNVKEPGGLVKLNISDSKWIPGDLLYFSLCEAIYKENSFDEIINILRKYHDELIKNYSFQKQDNEGYPLLNYDAADFIPINIILNDNEMIGIDNEWISSFPLSADYVLFRGLFYFVSEQYPFILRNMRISDIDTFIISIIKKFYHQYDNKRYEMNKRMEEEFQSLVQGKIIKIPSPDEIKRQDSLWQKDEIIRNILNSNSWKITAPLRWISKMLKKFIF